MFSSSLPHHASLINRLSAVQSQVSDARSSLLEAKEALGSKRADLVQLWSRSHILEEMIRLLDQMYAPTCTFSLRHVLKCSAAVNT
jgi:exocyst complex component 4